MNLQNELEGGRAPGVEPGRLERRTEYPESKITGAETPTWQNGFAGGVSGTGDTGVQVRLRREFQGLKNLEGGTGTRAGLVEGGGARAGAKGKGPGGRGDQGGGAGSRGDCWGARVSPSRSSTATDRLR